VRGAATLGQEAFVVAGTTPHPLLADRPCLPAWPLTTGLPDLTPPHHQAYQAALSQAPPDSSHNPALEGAIEAMHTHNAWQVDNDVRRMLEAVGLNDPSAQV
jgi:hypothetical protein